MSQTPTTKKDVDWKKLLNATGPYPVEAFSFIRDGLTYTAGRIHAQSLESDSPPISRGDSTGRAGGLSQDSRHINGQQLCLGLRDFAIQEFGLLAPVVLEHWHVRRTDDFGRIVFAMIAEGLMSKTADDNLEDFRAVYDFEEAFSAEQLILGLGPGHAGAANGKYAKSQRQNIKGTSPPFCL